MRNLYQLNLTGERSLLALAGCAAALAFMMDGQLDKATDSLHAASMIARSNPAEWNDVILQLQKLAEATEGR